MSTSSLPSFHTWKKFFNSVLNSKKTAISTGMHNHGLRVFKRLCFSHVHTWTMLKSFLLSNLDSNKNLKLITALPIHLLRFFGQIVQVWLLTQKVYTKSNSPKQVQKDTVTFPNWIEIIGYVVLSRCVVSKLPLWNCRLFLSKTFFFLNFPCWLGLIGWFVTEISSTAWFFLDSRIELDSKIKVNYYRQISFKVVLMVIIKVFSVYWTGTMVSGFRF